MNGLKLIFDQGRKCKKLRTDNGSEFISNETRTCLKQEGIYYFTAQNSNTKANVAARVIHTIKNMMYRYFTKNRTHCYIDVLEDIVKSYNATPHKCLNLFTSKTWVITTKLIYELICTWNQNNQRKTSHPIISKLGIKLDFLTRTCYLIVHTTNILPEKF